MMEADAFHNQMNQINDDLNRQNSFVDQDFNQDPEIYDEGNKSIGDFD